MKRDRGLDPELHRFLNFLQRHPEVRHRLVAPPGRTIVYCGAMPEDEGGGKVWQFLEDQRRKDPKANDFVMLSDLLKEYRTTEFKGSLYEVANAMADRIKNDRLSANPFRESLIVWRALSGIYVQGAVGKVRAYVRPDADVTKTVFALTEVHLLTRPDVIAQIGIDARVLKDFKAEVKKLREGKPGNPEAIIAI